MLKIAVVYTGTTPQLIELVEKEINNVINCKYEILSYKDPSIIGEARENGYVTSNAASRLIRLFTDAVTDGADIILNACSSVGEVVDNFQPLANYLGVPVVRIDEKMCREAVIKNKRIGVIATLATTMEPTKQTLKRVGREVGTNPILVDGLIDGAFDLDEDEFKQVILEKVLSIKEQVDVVVFCQGSMAYCEEYIQQNAKVNVLSSPKYGAIALKEKLEIIGKLVK